MRPFTIITAFLATFAVAAPGIQRRSLISDVTGVLGSVGDSISNLNTEIEALSNDLATGNVNGVLNDVKNDIAGDITLVQTILADIGIGLDLSQVVGSVDNIINIVEILYNQVAALESETSVTGTVREVETLINTLLADLRKLL